MAILLMVVVTIVSVFFIVELGQAGKVEAAEIVLSKAWTYRFEKLALEEKKNAYLEDYEKYHAVSEKKMAKVIKEWDKQIDCYQKKEDAYLSGQRFSVLDSISLVGYRLLEIMKLNGNSSLLRTLAVSCEQAGYVELERDQKTSRKRNSYIYASYLLASLFSFLYLGILSACFLGVVTIAAGNEGMGIVFPMMAGFGISALYGYVPYDNLRVKASKRQEEINQNFPNAISKIALLVTAGMNITKAIEETAYSGKDLIYQELRLTVKELNQAATMQDALTRLQHRCNNKYLDKMVTIIAKSYVSGNDNLANDLKVVNDECWLDKKHNARRMSEMVQNKLFIPTMLMFIGILVVIVIPAMSGFNL